MASRARAIVAAAILALVAGFGGLSSCGDEECSVSMAILGQDSISATVQACLGCTQENEDPDVAGREISVTVIPNSSEPIFCQCQGQSCILCESQADCPLGGETCGVVLSTNGLGCADVNVRFQADDLFDGTVVTATIRADFPGGASDAVLVNFSDPTPTPTPTNTPTPTATPTNTPIPPTPTNTPLISP